MKIDLVLKAIMLHLFLLLLISLQPAPPDYCPSTFKGHYSPCSFEYGYQDENCTQFAFYNCSWKECVGYVSNENTQQCVQYQTFTATNWSYCMAQCCVPSKNYEYNSSSLQQCEDDKKGAPVSLWVIIFWSCLGGGIVLIFFICYLLKKFKCIIRCRWRCICFKKNVEQNAQEVQRKKQIELSKVNKWNKEHFQNQSLFQICCICLDNRPTVQLQCGHVNHRSCIIAWMKKQQQCPLCRVSNFSWVKVYCQKCLQQYFQVNLLAHKNQVQSAMQICNNCK